MRLASIAVGLMLGLHPEAPAAGKLTVVVTGFKGTEGQALVQLHVEDGWPKVKKAFRVVTAPIEGESVRVELEGVPVGTYAVMAVHDANKNGKLDMHWLPIPGPDEGGGCSNGATATAFGPPKFSDAKFELGPEGKLVEIAIRYP